MGKTPALNVGNANKDHNKFDGGLSRTLAAPCTLSEGRHFPWSVTGSMFQSPRSMFITQQVETWIAVVRIAARKDVRRNAPRTPRGLLKE